MTVDPDGGHHTLPIATSAVFVLIGAVARNGAVRDLVATDRSGFLLTGPDTAGHLGSRTHPPLLLETSEPGVLAVGDIRSGSSKRIATAVGDGAMAVRFAHELITRAASGPPGTLRSC